MLPRWWKATAPFKIGDFLEEAKTIPDNSVDLIITSPPYNSGQEYEKEMTIGDYIQFADRCSLEMARIIKGRICLNIAFDTETKERKNVPIPLVQIWMNALSKAELKYRDTIVWNKLNCHSDTAWGSFRSASAPHLRHIAEAVLVYYKNDWKIGSGKNNISSYEFTRWSLNIWTINTAKRLGHPCPYPVELAERCIKMYSHIGQIVLDPFLGQGTTLRACRETNRIGLGFEINPKYEPIIINHGLTNEPDITGYQDEDNECLKH